MGKSFPILPMSILDDLLNSKFHLHSDWKTSFNQRRKQNRDIQWNEHPSLCSYLQHLLQQRSSFRGQIATRLGFHWLCSHQHRRQPVNHYQSKSSWYMGSDQNKMECLQGRQDCVQENGEQKDSLQKGTKSLPILWVRGWSLWKHLVRQDLVDPQKMARTKRNQFFVVSWTFTV